jgi:hypothetical protein
MPSWLLDPGVRDGRLGQSAQIEEAVAKRPTGDRRRIKGFYSAGFESDCGKIVRLNIGQSRFLLLRLANLRKVVGSHELRFST